MAYRKARVYVHGIQAGILEETDDGYAFSYDEEYLANPDAKPVSLTLPLSSSPYTSQTMFPFFDGLIPEGWLLSVALDNWKLDAKDRMGLLGVACRDTIGAVALEKME